MEKKNSKLTLGKESNKLLEVFFEIQSLKNLFRQGWLKNGVEKKFCESVADHSFSTAMLAWLLADEYFPDLDISKIIKYSLIHEIGEIYAGDITPDDNITEAIKYELELASVKKVFSKLANGKKYIKIWEEFEHSKNKEAKFIKQIDRLEMAFQAYFYENKLELNLQDFKDSTKKVLNDDILKDLLQSLD
ncbi:MAG: HD domain-containing protein [Candidatus Cloacimonetes bacterium]|jgi:putative hydrolases of HD superfamily|nr:HD domain-containing protein [Candidatus Cloacimonadota bacterium]